MDLTVLGAYSKKELAKHIKELEKQLAEKEKDYLRMAKANQEGYKLNLELEREVERLKGDPVK